MSILEGTLNGSEINTPYDGSGSLTVIYTEARNFDTYDQVRQLIPSRILALTTTLHLGKWIGPGLEALTRQTLPLASLAFAKIAYPRLGILSQDAYAGLNHTRLSSLVTAQFGA